VLVARKRDEADMTGLLEINKEKITKEEIRYVGDRLLELCFTAEDRAKTVQQLEWLNEALTQLGMSDRTFPVPK
jgi:hypothetical protein